MSIKLIAHRGVHEEGLPYLGGSVGVVNVAEDMEAWSTLLHYLQQPGVAQVKLVRR